MFLDMPPSTRELYFQLGMHCDDDGFVYPKKVMRMVGASDDELKLLLTKKFILPFESGVMVVKHWKVNNYIRPDRYHPTTHKEEQAQLSLDNSGVYSAVTNRLPDGIPSGSISKEVSKKESSSDFSSIKERISEIAKDKRTET